MDEKKETTDNPLLKNMCGRWRPQCSDWPVLAYPSTAHHMLASRNSRKSCVTENMASCSSENVSVKIEARTEISFRGSFERPGRVLHSSNGFRQKQNMY